MNAKSKTISSAGSTAQNDKAQEPRRGRVRILLATGAAALLLAYFAFSNLGPAKSTPETASPAASLTVARPPTIVAAIPRVTRPPGGVVRAPESAPANSSGPALPAPRGRGVSAATAAEELVERMRQPEFFSGGVSPQKAEQVIRSFKQLAEQGAAAVPAIREYLDRFQDIDFDAVGAGKLIGYPSLRIGLLDALGQIGGPEATDLSLQILENTGDPQEIAFLAKGLEKQLPPEQLRPIALAAASDALAQALGGESDGRNLAPLFEVLQKFGDQNVVGLLEQAAGKWNFYATLALAGLPDGAGVPALVKLAQDAATSGVGNVESALRPLAQAATQFPAARAALVEQARLNQVPDSAWPGIAASLEGNYILYGKQIFGSTAPPVVWSPEQINLRLELIDQMLAVTTSPAAVGALQNARAQVLSKPPKK